VSREDIAALDEIDPSERRKLWQFVQARQVVNASPFEYYINEKYT
jgi:hypothetical protein